MRRRPAMPALAMALATALATAAACRPAPAPMATPAQADHGSTTRLAPPATAPAVGPALDRPGEVRSLATGRRPADAAAVVAAALPVAAAALRPGTGGHLHLEGVDWPGPAAAVVTVLALELAGTEVRTRRVAVPISLVDGEPRIAGPPLLLPAGRATEAATPLATSPIDDDRTRAAAIDALTSAGFREVRLVRLERAIEAWPVVATFGALGTGPDLVAWLRRDGARLVVAGLPDPGPASPTRPQEDPE